MYGYRRTDKHISQAEIDRFKESLKKTVSYSSDYGEMATVALDIIYQLEDQNE